MAKFYFYFGIILLATASISSYRGWSFFSALTTGRWSPTGPRTFHK